MSNTIRLIKIYLLNNLGINKLIHQKGGKMKAIAVLIGFSLLGLMILATSAFYSYMIAEIFSVMDLLRILPALMMAVSSLMTLVTTIYKAGSVLFSFQDYDLVMSLPISQKSVVASRIVILYLMNELFALVLLLPMMVVYAIFAQPGIAFYGIFFLTLLCVPMLPVVIASVIGVVVSMISARFRHKNLVGTLLMLLAVLAIMIGSFGLDGSSMEQIGELGTAFMKTVNRIYPLAGMYTDALCDGKLLPLLGFLACSVLPFALFVMIVSKWFQTMHTFCSSVGTRSNFVLGKEKRKTHTPFLALYQKEFRRFLSSPLYILNTSIGMILSVILAVAIFFVPSQTMEQMVGLPGFSQMISLIAPIFLSFFIGMSSTSACSISLEGKSLWIIRSLPVDTSTIFAAKIGVNLTITVPISILDSFLLGLFLQPDLIGWIGMFVIPLLYCFYISLAGLACNLRFPNFAWTSETAVIKQSAATFCGVMSGMLPVVGAIALMFVVPSLAAWIPLIFGVVIFLTTIFLCAFLYKIGIKQFESF